MYSQVMLKIRFIILKIVSRIIRSKTVTFNGASFLMKISNSHELQRALTFARKEPDTLAWLQHYADKPVDLVDIGANIGIYSLYFAIVGSRETAIYSIEPDATSFASLTTNIALNRLGNINAYMLAFSDETGWSDLSLQIYEPGAGAGSVSGDYMFIKKKKNQIPVVQKVMTQTGDEFFGTSAVLREFIVKIDVDGHELSVLQGMKNLLRSEKALSVLVEVNSRSSADLSAVRGILEGAGLHLVGEGCWSQKAGDFLVANYLFSKPSERACLSQLDEFSPLI